MYLSIQCRLTVGAPDDPLEREADAMADTVMRMPVGDGMSFSRSSSLQRKCAACEEEEEIQRKSLVSFIQRKSSDGNTVVSDSVAGRINSSKGGGSVLDDQTLGFMENRFGADFSNVRVHTGSYAAELSNDLNAQAFTLGNDIYFNSGKYDPSSGSGKHLLAHELTHTIQQQGSIGRKIQRTSAAARVHRHLSAMVGGVLTPDFTTALAVLGGLNLTDMLETTNDLSTTDIRSLMSNLVAATPNRDRVSITLRVAQLNREPLNVSLAQSGRLVTDIAALPDAEALQVNRYLNRHQSRTTQPRPHWANFGCNYP